MIYTTQKWNKNTIRFQSESSPIIGLPGTPESNFRKIIVQHIFHQSQIEIAHDYNLSNKIDNQVIII